jgi:hypothetical protein
MTTGRKEKQVYTPAPSPSRAIQGLFLYLSCRCAFLIYLIWVVVPDKWLKHVGLAFLPHKYWAVALPVLVCVLLAFTAFLIYPALGLIMTPAIEEQNSFVEDNDFHNDTYDLSRTFPSQKFVPTAHVSKTLYSELKK